jgi:mannan endo-1,4-beta-mannosidase
LPKLNFQEVFSMHVDVKWIVWWASLFITLSSFAMEKPDYIESTGFYVAEGKVYNPDGTEFIMRGIDHNHSWGSEDISLNSIPEIAKTGTNIVRCVFWNESWAQYWGRTPQGRRHIVEKYISMGIIPMIEFHEATCGDDPAQIMAIVDHWLEQGNLDILNDYEQYVILNIANEWGPAGDGSRWDVWANAYKSAIIDLRDAGVNNLIVIDSPECGQNGKAMQVHGRELLDFDPQHNVMFSIHFYGNWRTLDDYSSVNGTTAPWGVENELGNMVKLGLPVVVGEFSWDEADAVPYSTERVIKFCQENSIGWLAWSWNMNSDPLLDMVTNYRYSELKPYGELIVNHPRYGLGATSHRASIFGTADAHPVVTLTSPADSAVFEIGQPVSITAAAIDPDGTVEKVRFYSGDTMLGEDASSPYQCTWDNLYRGWYPVYAAAWDDSGRIGSSQEINIVVGKRELTRHAALVVGNTALSTADAVIRDRLSLLGFQVQVLQEKNADATNLTGQNLIFISTTVNHRDISSDLTSIAIPLINAESLIFDELGMTGAKQNTDQGNTGGQTITITNPNHMMAAGLSGTVQVLSAEDRLVWGKPAPSAQVIAELAGDPGKAVLFGYDTGDQMISLPAPARRVGIFLSYQNAPRLTIDGWRLFDAAVDWAIDNSNSSVQDRMAGHLNQFQLAQNYPNPFNPETTIDYTIASPGHVHLTIHDVLGREVAVLVDEEQSAGQYKISFHADHLASGIYTYTLLSGDFSLSRKLILLR